MNDKDWLAERFEEHRGQLRAVAYRMLGSLTDADDAVQEGWLRLSRSNPSEIENLGAWLTTVVARICLNILQGRTRRREEPLDAHVPDPVVTFEDRLDPEQEVLLADSVGLALLIVLDTLTPAERLAFVLHDTFDLPFQEIAAIVGRSPVATRQLASRARRRVRRAGLPEHGRGPDRSVVDAFLAAAREGDFRGLLKVLDPDVVLRADVGPDDRGGVRVIRGAAAVAERAVTYGQQLGDYVRPAFVNGAPGIIAASPEGRLRSVLGITVAGGRIVEIDILTDPARLSRLDLRSADQ